jgi:hypothetical protein
MSIRRPNISSNVLVYIIIALVVVILIMIFGGAHCTRGVNSRISLGIEHWNWAQILISVGIGFILGWIAFRRKW